MLLIKNSNKIQFVVLMAIILTWLVTFFLINMKCRFTKFIYKYLNTQLYKEYRF